jgi:predicted RNA methylase
VNRRALLVSALLGIAMIVAAAMTLTPGSWARIRSAILIPPQREPDVIFVTTPEAVVKAMLDVASVGPNDLVIDLGSGDGRIVIAAAKDRGARGIGIELDEQLIAEARENARKAGVADRVEFRRQDLFQADISRATVVTLYLLPPVNLKLRPKLLAELKPGTRVVSHAFHMGDWIPDRVVDVDGRKVYFWVVPAGVNGHR